MKPIVCLVLACTATGWSNAQDLSALQRCRSLPDSAARLACYDAVVLPVVSSPPALRSGGVAPQAPALARPEALSPPSAPAVNPAQTFGMERRAAPAQELPALESAIPGRFDGWVARQRLRLTNGQVWEVSDGSQAAYDLRDPKVRITRGMSGTFFMEIEGVAQMPRVRRIE